MSSQTIGNIKWLKRAWKPVLLLLLGIFILNYALAASRWQKLTHGLGYQELRQGYAPWSHIHVFRINLDYHQLALVMAKDLALKHASADEYAKRSQSLITINGGFFDHNFEPLGLRINHHHEKNPLKNISWWGVFFIKNNKAFITSAKQFNQDQSIDFALQSGPRLLINGRIPPLKPGRAQRSALGITKEGQVIILITENAPLSTTELAQVMKAPPLNCTDALNLDGGSSTQLHADVDAFKLTVHGFSNVSDAVIVKEKLF